jgi:hypothetical protein
MYHKWHFIKGSSEFQTHWCVQLCKPASPLPLSFDDGLSDGFATIVVPMT